jgi:putative ABC transport system permease protein
MHSLLQSLRYTTRLLLKSPGFTITAVLILGFGIGANTAIFSLINAVLLNPLTVPRPDQLVQIFQPQENDHESLVDYPDYLDLLGSQHSFDSLSVWDWDWVDFSGQGNPEHLTAVFASNSLFQVTSLPFILGRPFGDAEDKPGGPLVVVLNESLWRNRFNSDPNIIGKNPTLSGENFQVIWVCRTHAGDLAALPSQLLYMPLPVSEFFGRASLERRGAHTLNCIGRLKEGIPLPQAQADLEVIQGNLSHATRIVIKAMEFTWFAFGY